MWKQWLDWTKYDPDQRSVTSHLNTSLTLDKNVFVCDERTLQLMAEMVGRDFVPFCWGLLTRQLTSTTEGFMIRPALLYLLSISFQGVCGALTVLMRDAIKPNLMQTLEVWEPTIHMSVCVCVCWICIQLWALGIASAPELMGLDRAVGLCIHPFYISKWKLGNKETSFCLVVFLFLAHTKIRNLLISS